MRPGLFRVYSLDKGRAGTVETPIARTDACRARMSKKILLTLCAPIALLLIGLSVGWVATGFRSASVADPAYKD
jgi:hypothetical protein